MIIDVREPAEYASGHVQGALNIPPAVMMQGLPRELTDTPKDTKNYSLLPKRCALSYVSAILT